jgi:hypothetical protein
MTETTRVRTLPRRPSLVPSEATAVPTSLPKQIVASEKVKTQATARPLVYRVRQGIYLLSVLIPALIALRSVLQGIGADATSGFGAFVYGITAPLVAPFTGLLGLSQPGSAGPEPHAGVAMVTYLLIAWLLAGAVWVLWGERPSAASPQPPAASSPPPAEALPAGIA